MKRPSIAARATVFALAAALAGANPLPAAGPASGAAGAGTSGIAESTLGLGRTKVRQVLAPPAVKPEGAQPGERERRTRAYPGAPPQVPHGVADFLPITRESHACLECHSKEGAVESGAVPLPNSHYTDLRRSPDQVGTRLAGARYLCISCHAFGSDAKPLVGNAPPRRSR